MLCLKKKPKHLAEILRLEELMDLANTYIAREKNRSDMRDEILDITTHDYITIPNQERISIYGRCPRCHGSGRDPIKSKPLIYFENGQQKAGGFIHIDCIQCAGSGYNVPVELERELNNIGIELVKTHS